MSILSWPSRHPKSGLLAAAAIALLALFGALRIRPDASLVEMMASDSPAAAALGVLRERFPDDEELIIIASLPPGQSDRALLESFAQRFKEAARSSSPLKSMVRAIRSRTHDEAEETFFNEVLAPNAIYSLSEQEFSGLRERLTGEEIRAQVRRSERLISAPGALGSASVEPIARDPLHLHELLDDRGAEAWFLPLGDMQAGRTVSVDGRSIMIRLRGAEPPGNLEFTRAFVEQVEAVIDGTNRDGLAVELTGAYAIAREAERSIRRDMITSDAAAITLILGLFLLVYRGVMMLVLTIVPVALGILIGFGLFSLLSTSLTPLTAVIGAIIAGLGVDYAIHYVAHARRTDGGSASAGSERTSRELFGPLALAVGTSIAAFAAAMTSVVPAVRHFGMIGAFGLAGAFAMTLLVIPAGLSLWKGASRKPIASQRADWCARTIFLIRRHHRILIGASAIILAAAIIVVVISPRPVFPVGSDLHAMHPQPNRPLELLDEIATRFGAGGESWPVLIESDSSESILARAHDVHRALAALVEEQNLRLNGLATLLSDPSQAANRQRELRNIDVDRVLADLDAALSNSIFDPQAFDEFRTLLRDLLSPGPPPGLDHLRSVPALAERLLASSQGGDGTPKVWTVLLIERREPFHDSQQRQAFVDGLRRHLSTVPGATLTGISVVGMETERSILRGLQRVALVALVAIVVMLAIGLRRPLDVLLVLVPAAAGLIVVLAFVHLAGESINLVNLLGVPLLIGLGIDEGIFFVSTARRVNSGGNESAAANLQAVLLTTGTDVLAFGSVALTSTPAIRSLGIFTGLGVIACLLATIFFLLPILFLREEWGARRLS